ncbi:MAG TPA: coproporphyrinogen-III oxidase family protein [Methylomirabilota bacterium]|jgi:oxygen-independent coproporphyrinogen-3 oxidase|nr:coproporphyrinogen-III oxidase family protein [Methylomirabilota bacterium]
MSVSTPTPTSAPPLQKETTVGNYFVSNYPPFSFWKPEFVSQITEAIERPPADVPLGLYVHIPFCRKRCHFCYFKVYTDKDSAAIRGYLEAVLQEFRLYAGKPFIGGRKPNFIYFGGGTPSYLSVDQLRQLTDGMKALLPWDEAEEVTFECEPGTLTDHKLKAIREIGVTRLSLGVENFDDHILEINGRAHHSKEIARAYAFAREIGFPQINIDLIAGMVEETEANWRECVRKVIEMAPDSVTIYEMEIPYNTTIYKQMKAEGKLVAPVADWETKRGWVHYAFAELEKAGYTVGSAYTAVKNPDRTKFVYRDRLWAGADLLSLGVASFGHINGRHYQNQHDFDPYTAALKQGKLPHWRAFTPTDEERFIREFILQLKLGHLSRAYFVKKFGADPADRFAAPLQRLKDWGFLEIAGDQILLNREGLLQVDRLLPEFFLPQHQTARYA